MMDGRKTAIERAFELASSGEVTSLSELRRALAGEGYPTAQVVGPQMMRQLRLLMHPPRRASATDSQDPVG